MLGYASDSYRGLLKVSEDALKLVIFGGLTTGSVEQAVVRVEHASGYAESAVEMVNRVRVLRERVRGRVGLV